MTLIAGYMNRGADVDRCSHCGKFLRPTDRIFYVTRGEALYCSVRCFEASKKQVDIHSNAG